ncbi:MAG: hypothetical protein ACO1QR_08720 [Chthoniobacteraceae bacterium]
MKTPLCFTPTEVLILLLQAAAVGAIITLISLTGATGGRILLGAATLALILAKVAAAVRRGKLVDPGGSGISRE